MSPNEEQLRAALRQGEGERPDADLIIERAQDARRSRRRVAWAIAASAATVIAIGGGITALSLQHSETSTTSSGAGAGGPEPLRTPANGAAAPGASPRVESPAASSALACPSTPPTLGRPNVSTGRLLPEGIIAIRICLYQAGTPTFAGTTELTDTAAAQLAQRLEDSPLPTPTTPCTADLGPTVLMLGRTAATNAPIVVGNLGGCGEITNGQAVRLAHAVLQDEARVILQQPGSPGRNSHGPGPS